MLYAIGKPWKRDDDTLGVAFYTYLGEIHKGSREEAQRFLEYVEDQTSEKHYIYRVKRLGGSEDL